MKGATALLKGPRKEVPKVAATDMESQLVELIDVNETDFSAPATERANRMKEYFLQAGKVEAERVFLADPSARGKESKSSRVYLNLR